MLESLYKLNGNPNEALQEIVQRYGAGEDDSPAPFGVVERIDRVLAGADVDIGTRQRVKLRLEHDGLDRAVLAPARPTLLGEVEALLADVNVQPEVKQRVKAVYELPDTASYPEIFGGLGLYLFLDSVTAASLEEMPSAENREKANTILQVPTVKESFRAIYRLGNDCDLDKARLHRVGTTSLIIECVRRPEGESGESQRVALKCVLPRHFSVRAIADSTHSYKARHAISHPSVPNVYDSSDRMIMMEFVDGQTLAERLASEYRFELPEESTGEERAEQRALGSADIRFIHELSHALCEILSQLRAMGSCHLDLSPKNIILVQTDPITLRLIDFGPNFAIAEGVGTSPALVRAAVYVESEMRAGHRLGDWRSDCYSLGMILLEAAAGKPLYHETVVSELNRLWTGDPPWDGAPGLARIVEDLIDEVPEQRLVFMTDTDNPEYAPYRYIDDLVREETEVMQIYEERTESRGFGILRGLAVFKVWKNPQLLNMLEAGKKTRHLNDDAYRDLPKLARWARVSITCWSLVLTAFVVFTLADLRVAAFEPTVREFDELIGNPFVVGDFWSNLPGRLVAVTFALTSVTYYVNNFALLSPRSIGTSLGKWSERVMRACPPILAIPVLWALIYKPHAWPLCSGIGTLLVVLNNFLALRIAYEAEKVGKRFSTRGSAGRDFIRDLFKEWWALMGAYSVSMIAIGILLITKEARDERVYAALVVVINLLKMYRLNCTKLAPQVRGCLSRDIFTVRRARRLDDRLSVEIRQEEELKRLAGPEVVAST